MRLGARPGGGARLLVADAGPGLRVGADVLRRGASGGGSTGLGLDIARRTAEQAGGGLTLGRSARGGLTVIVDRLAERSLSRVLGLGQRGHSVPGANVDPDGQPTPKGPPR